MISSYEQKTIALLVNQLRLPAEAVIRCFHLHEKELLYVSICFTVTFFYIFFFSPCVTKNRACNFKVALAYQFDAGRFGIRVRFLDSLANGMRFSAQVFLFSKMRRKTDCGSAQG